MVALARPLERVYAAAAAGDGNVLAQAIQEPFFAHTAGHGVLGGTSVGLAAFRGHIAQLRALSGGTLGRKTIEFYADDRWAVTPQIIVASLNGRDLQMAATGFWRFSAPGRIGDHWEAVADEAAWDAFWHLPG